MDEQYTPSDGELQELIVGLLLDAGDYVRHSQPYPGETLTWDQREVRAWRAARLLSERHAHDARVRRAAAREALDGLIADAEADMRIGAVGHDDERIERGRAVVEAAVIFRDDEYPEETP